MHEVASGFLWIERKERERERVTEDLYVYGMDGMTDANTIFGPWDGDGDGGERGGGRGIELDAAQPRRGLRAENMRIYAADGAPSCLRRVGCGGAPDEMQGGAGAT